MATYVGKWDCPACGTQRIPGWKDGRTVERCPACGAPSTGKWYMDDRSMVIADAQEIARAKAKRAWKCGHCNHMNDADDQDCDACGNPRDAGTDDKQFVAREYAAFQQPTSGDDIIDADTENVTENPAAIGSAYSKSGLAKKKDFEERMRITRKRRWIFAGISAGVLTLIVLLLLWKKEVNVSVVGFEWQRTVEIENFGPVQETSWSSPPAGAYSISSQSEIHHYNTIVVSRDCHDETVTEVCGTIDNGNGTFSDRYCTSTQTVCHDVTREEPVYQTRYYYTIDRWHADHTEKAGAFDHKAFWPVFAQTVSSPGTWREGQRTESYWLHLLRDGGGKKERQSVEAERWNRTQMGQVLKGYKNVVFGYWMGLKNEPAPAAKPK